MITLPFNVTVCVGLQLIALITKAAKDSSAKVLACLFHARALSRECAVELGDEKQLDARGHAAASIEFIKLLRCIALKAGVPSLQKCFQAIVDAGQHVLDAKTWQVRYFDG